MIEFIVWTVFFKFVMFLIAFDGWLDRNVNKAKILDRNQCDTDVTPSDCVEIEIRNAAEDK